MINNTNTAQPQTGGPLDMNAVAEARTMMRDKFPRMITYFVEDSTMYMEQIEAGFLANNAEAVVPPAHTLKSSSRQMGAVILAAIAKEIEFAAREVVKGNGTLDSIRSRLPELKEILAQTQKAYEQYKG